MEWGFWSLYQDNRIRLTQLCIWLELCRTSGDKSPRRRFIFPTLWQLAGEHLGGGGGVLYLSAMCAVDGMTVMHNLACAENILRSSSGSAVRSHPLLDWRRLSRGAALSESQPPLLSSIFFFSLTLFGGESLHDSLFLPPLTSSMYAREAPDWLQAFALPGLTSRHCFCPLNRINKSMCQVDCSQETMTQFWHHCAPPYSPSPPPSASLQLLIKKTLLSWLYVLPWGCLTALFSSFPCELGVGMMKKKKSKVNPCVLLPPRAVTEKYSVCSVTLHAHVVR